MNQTSKLERSAAHSGRSSGLGRISLRRSRPPAFSPVKLRGRKDGWSVQVQCAFLAALYQHGSVLAAAKAVGRSRASAYKLRERPDATSFAASWDKVLSGPSRGWRKGRVTGRIKRPIKSGRVLDWRKLTVEQLFWRHEQGLLRPVIHRGQMCAIARKPDNTALLRLLARLDKSAHQAQPRQQRQGNPSFLKPRSQCVRTGAGEVAGAGAGKVMGLEAKPPNPSPQQSRQ